MHLATQVDEVSEQCEVRRAFYEALPASFAETSAVSRFNEDLRF